MDGQLCPRCGAYWRCDCAIEELRLPPPAPPPPLPGGCQHDWNEALGVDVDRGIDVVQARVLVCRLCGLYAVEEARQP